jgi:Family of unknown function (DUF5681)
MFELLAIAAGSTEMTGGGKPPPRYAPGNTREDGSYRVGKNRPPEHGQFREGDGRRRGRRPKGQRNFDTEFDEESQRRMTLRENGKVRRVSKQRGAIIRAYDSAISKGDPRAQSLVFSHASRISDKRAPQAASGTPDDEELNAWLRDRLAAIELSEPEPLDQPHDPPSSRKRRRPG